MNEDYKKNEFYGLLVQLDRLISDLSDEDPDDDIVKELDSYCQTIMEDYQLLHTDYEDGYVEGIKDAVDIFKQIRDQY